MADLNDFLSRETLSEISILIEKNKLLSQALHLLNTNEEVRILWKITNVTAISRLEMTDHGILHFQIVVNNALKMIRILHQKKIEFSIMKDYGLSYEHAELVIFLASLLHDIGMSIHRLGHEEYSLFLANSLLRETLTFLPIAEKTIIISEVLHAIISHRSGGKPFTIEAGIVRVADALDMSEGRTRFDYDDDKIDIHSVSALAIDEVEILAGKKCPLQIQITMNHTAGLFQIDELLKKKIVGSGIERFLEVKIYMNKGSGKQLFKDFYKG